MKRLIVLVGLFAYAITAMAQTPTDYQQWELMYIKPKADKVDLFKKGLAAHNKKYHSADPYKAGVASVITGPNSGDFVWFMGPTTWTQMDSRPGKGEHDADWDKNVTPYVQSTGEVSYWRKDKDLMYVPAGANVSNLTKGRLRYTTLLPGQDDRYAEAIKKVVEVYKKKGYAGAFSVYWRYGQSRGSDVATSLDFEKWAYLDAGNNIAKDFEEIHGANSWVRFMEEVSMCTDRIRTYDELSEYMPDLSGN